MGPLPLPEEEEIFLLNTTCGCCETWVVWSGLGISNKMADMIGCSLAEAWRWQGQRAKAGAGRHGVNLWRKTCSVWTWKWVGTRQGYAEGLILGEPFKCATYASMKKGRWTDDDDDYARTRHWNCWAWWLPLPATARPMHSDLRM